MAAKKRVADFRREFDPSDLCGSASDVQNKINEFLLGVSNDATIEDISEWDSPTKLQLTSFRDETAQEIARRRKRKADENKRIKEAELAQLERLKKKYSGIV